MATGRTLRATAALVDGRWQADATIAIGADGDILADAEPDARTETIDGVVVPGLPNLHSHAFQRAMAGLAERTPPAGTADDFWGWRDVMYRFMAALSPDDVEAIAAQLYAECLRHGFTSVGEFHYTHNDVHGGAYADPAELSWRIMAAADEAGIGLTLLPVLYQTSQFGGVAPLDGQRRFVMSLDRYASLVEVVAARCAGDPNRRVGIAPHSLRAVTPDALDAALALRAHIDPAMPVHIHAAEQPKEVADCLAWSGRRPVEWLLDRGAGDGWCLIHATHMTDAERQRLAASGAVAGLCPATEANLGDGLFPIRDFIAEGGSFGVGTDSHVSTSPVEELRWLEYGCRLARRARNVSETAPETSVGAGLLRRALEGGATALGRPIGSLAPGGSADLVVLDPEHPALVGRSGDRLLDAWIFAGNDTPVRHVMVGGRWVVRDGRHVRGDAVAARYRSTMKRLAESLG